MILFNNYAQKRNIRTLFGCFFLSKPQAWYIITRQRASYLRLEDIQRFVLVRRNFYEIDEIQGLRLQIADKARFVKPHRQN